MNIKWLGHAGFKIDNLIIDPFVERIEHWGLEAPYTLKQEDLENIDVVVITHGHADHFQGAKTIAEKTGATVIGTGENLHASELFKFKHEDLNIGGSIEIAGWKITFVQAHHSGNPVGVILEKDGLVLYHTGDTGLFSDMKLYKELYAPNVLLLPIGGRYTMDIKQAIKAVEFVEPKFCIPMHYNTFAKINADVNDFKTQVETKTKTKVKVLKIGEQIVL